MSTPGTETYGDAAHTYRFSSSVSEIVEEEEGNNSRELFEINHGVLGMPSIKEEVESSLFSFDFNGGSEDEERSVYVAVGKSESSMDALSWTLSHFVDTSTTLYLIHVFPEIRHIPSPLGMLPKSQVSPAQVEKYMEQEREKRRQLLQKFLDNCSASKVKVDTVLIESDMVARAILDLIPILNIRKLVVGTRNSNPRKLKSRRASAIADEIFRSAPNSCEVKVICEGNEVVTQMIESPLHSPSPLANEDSFNDLDDHHNASFVCMCFKPNNKLRG
ncbi:hypothetical protein PTKIN_Ptkin13bG0164500 [Pterospermum kingtungense]